MTNILSKFMKQLRILVYDHHFRHNLLTGILKREEDIEEKIMNQEWQRFRYRATILAQKKKKLRKLKSPWFLSKLVVNTIKVTPTPNSTLKTVIQNNLESLGRTADAGRTKVIECGGNLVWMGMGGEDPAT